MTKKTVSTIVYAACVFATGELAGLTPLGDWLYAQGPWVAYVAWPLLVFGLARLTLRQGCSTLLGRLYWVSPATHTR